MKNKLQGRGYTRELVRIRDNHTCQDCGKKWMGGQRRFDCHHINGLCGKRSLKYDKIFDLDGLITLCHKCHFNRPEHRTQSKDWGVEHLKVAKDKRPNMKRLARKGYSYSQIGEEYGISRQRVHQIVHSIGVDKLD